MDFKLIIIFAFAWCAYANNCNRFRDCGECIKMSKCVFMKVVGPKFICEEKTSIMKLQPTAVYKTKARCQKIHLIDHKSSTDAIHKTNDDLLTKLPELTEENKLKQDPVTPAATDISNTSNGAIFVPNKVLSAKPENNAHSTRVLAGPSPPTARPMLRIIYQSYTQKPAFWMRAGKDYDEIKRNIVATACKLEALFRDFGDLRFLDINGIPDYKWVKFQISNPIATRLPSYCSVKN